jgi:prophage regulatory protein
MEVNMVDPKIKPEIRFVREPEVRACTGLSRATRWRLERAGDFPKRKRLSPNSVGWLASDIEIWMNERIGADVDR